MKKRIKRALGICLGLFILLGLSGWFLTPSPTKAVTEWPTSPAFYDRHGNLFHVRLSAAEEFCMPIPLHAMGQWLPLLLVNVEDKRFYDHSGVDFLALGRAILQNTTTGKRVSGASTISSQLIRIAIPRPRTLRTKLVEFTQALKLDSSFSKAQILELYLNRAPFGGTLRGVEAASRGYFAKSAHQLSLAESALLIGMLKGPTYYRPDLAPERSLARRNAILLELAEKGIIDQLTLERSLQEKLPKIASNLPSSAWHFAERALTEQKGNSEQSSPVTKEAEQPSSPSKTYHNWQLGEAPRLTSLDPQVQSLLSKELETLVKDLPTHITAAGAVLDNQTGELVAYVGNARFDRAQGEHWTDCGVAPRSPGSLLKPFVFAEAFRRGLLAPSQLLADSPLLFSGSAPRNFDREYRGPVTAKQALAFSLNAPAVRALRMVGGESALHSLIGMGFKHLNRSAEHYGDSLVLGGCEITLLEGAQAYAGLARSQGPLPLVMQATDTEGIYPPKWKSQPLSLAAYSPIEQGVSYLTTVCLTEERAVPTQFQNRMRSKRRMLAYKTGTSYGLRDAWAAGYTDKHTFIVWIGSPDNQSNDNLVGLSLAAPVLFAIAAEMPSGSEGIWNTPPPSIENYVACIFSGKPANPYCPASAYAERIIGVTQTMPCTMHRETPEGLLTVLPPELEEYAKMRDMAFEKRRQPEIVSPRPRATFFLNPHAPEQKLDLRAEGTTGTVYWYLNGTFLGEQEEENAMLWPMCPGVFTLSLLDEAGKVASTTFEVINAEKTLPSPLLFTP